MADSLLILGRQPALGLAELEALYGAAAVEPVGAQAALLHLDPGQLPFNRLGGSVKACRLLTTLDTTDWNKIATYLIEQTPEHAARLPEGKLTVGLSAYGLNVTPGKLNATGLSIKKAIRKVSGRSVRLVPNNETELSSAQVYHNHLIGDRAWELVLVADGKRTHLAQTFAVQDIDSYTLRDRGRPKRDTRVGMLPPKLAQIIINLAAGTRHQALGTSSSNLQPAAPSPPPVTLDPFCGTGVILQEALLTGFSAYGTDLESRMIDYTGENLDWLDAHFNLSPVLTARFEQGDATTYHWDPQPDIVATETYLGRPFTAKPAPELLAQTVSEANTILKKFLQNIGPQLKPGARLCLAVPAWLTDHGQVSSSIVRGARRASQRSVHKAYVSSEAQSGARNVPRKLVHLPLVDQISDLGYNRVSFEHVRDDQLLYYREDQIVARELLVITRK